MKVFFKDLWPSRTQYDQWSMPSKLTFISAYLGFLSLIITILTFTTTYFLSLNVEKALIQGRWDSEVANNVLLEEMEKFGDAVEYAYWDKNVVKRCSENPNGFGCNYEHNLLDTYYLKYKERDVIIAAGYSKQAGFECRACDVHISLIEFVKGEGGWYLNRKMINLLNAGSWGQPPRSMKIMPIGQDEFGIFIEHGFYIQGYESQSTEIYALVAEDFKRVFVLQTKGKTDDSQDNWQATIQIRSNNASFYDLIVNFKGVEKGKRFVNEKTYRFDGREYSASDTYK